MISMEQKWRRAREKAIEAHGSQLYGGRPYVCHLDEVATVLATHLHPGSVELDDHLAAAYLHDAIEDTAASMTDLADFGDVVVRAVLFCTDEPGRTRMVRKAATYARCAADIRQLPDRHVVVGLRVKLADRIANLRACLRDPDVVFPPEGGERTLLTMYIGEDVEFREAYGFTAHGRARDLASTFWFEYERLIQRARDVTEQTGGPR